MTSERRGEPMDPQVWLRGLLLGLLMVAGCDDSGGRTGDGSMGQGDDVAGKADGLGGDVATEAGDLRWDQMAALGGDPSGVPLFVSNNPEHVESYGILAGVPYPGLSLQGAQRKAGAPEAQWSRAIIDERCPNGGMREFGVYLAHILPSSLGSGRRLTLAVVPESDGTVEVRGQMGTTDWSSNGVSLTTTTHWLGAEVAKSFFFGGEPTQSLHAVAGKLLTIDSEVAKSLVEGRYHIESDTCLHPFTIAHSAGLGGVLPGHYAKGDVKWPGWSNGQGYGRAAGVYEGDEFVGQQTITIDEIPSVQGVGMLTSSDSMDALANHGDSAKILFGNYGVLYDHTLKIDNHGEQCVEAKVELVSYMDRNATSDRTPTVQFFLDTAGAYTPSMFWNGPVEATADATTKQSQAILRYAPTSAEQADPTRAMASMRHELASVRIEVGGTEDVRVRFPVPGYIVAPVALTVDARPCH